VGLSGRSEQLSDFGGLAVTLNNGVRMPMLGLGVYRCPPGQETERTVTLALQTGYRLIDTARFYANEKDVGNALRHCGIPREQVFVTTKLWKTDHGYDSTLRAFDASLQDLGLDYVDLYLIHWPLKISKPYRLKPLRRILAFINWPPASLRLQTWKAMERLLAGGRCRAVGVSNYTIRHLRELMSKSHCVPAVNQVEFTPFCSQRLLLQFCRDHGIQLEAYRPLTAGQRLAHPSLVRLASKYNRSPAQLLIRWAIQHEVVVIPKASNPLHMQENARVFDFSISDDDMESMKALNEDLHLCWDPTDLP
jgi:diketogulonate reductase-like aldo/keto reductase